MPFASGRVLVTVTTSAMSIFCCRHRLWRGNSCRLCRWKVGCLPPDHHHHKVCCFRLCRREVVVPQPGLRSPSLPAGLVVADQNCCRRWMPRGYCALALVLAGGCCRHDGMAGGFLARTITVGGLGIHLDRSADFSQVRSTYR